MKHPLIHIGFAKSGTTWLQNAVFSDASLGFSPVGGRPKVFGKHFIYERGGLDSVFAFDPAATVAEYEALAADEGLAPVISNENLLSHVFSGGVQAHDIACKLHTVFPKAKILITIREQVAITKSTYEHYLRVGGVCSLKRFLLPLNEGQIPFFHPGFFEYDRIVRRYRELFGEERVMVLPMERLFAAPSDRVRELCEFAGADVAGKDLGALDAREPANVSNKQYAAMLYLLRWCNHWGGPNNANMRCGPALPVRRVLKEASRLLPVKLVRSIHANRKRLIADVYGDRFAASNRRLAEMTGLDLAGHGYKL